MCTRIFTESACKNKSLPFLTGETKIIVCNNKDEKKTAFDEAVFFLLYLIVKFVTKQTGYTSPQSMSNETYQTRQGRE